MSVDPRTAPGGLRLLPYYLGGFLGPFGTMVPVPMLPDLRTEFGVDSATISWTVSAYLLPMATLLLVSGSIGERFGRARVLRVSLAVYLVASALVALAPDLGLFLAGRAAQGAANAFFTPLLLASLTEIAGEEHLGRRIGMYSSFQAVGGASAPFAGGLAAEVDWRLAFVVTAAVTAVILVGSPRRSSDGALLRRPPLRPLLSRRLLALGLASLATTAGPVGSQVILGLKIRDVLDVAPGPAGLMLAAGFVGPTLLGPSFGRLTDRYGAGPCGVVTLVASAVLVAVIGPLQSIPTVTVAWVAAGSLFGFATVVLHRVAAVIVPENRGGALSVVLAFRFLGFAIGPLIWVPVFTETVRGAFLGAGLLGLAAVAGLLSAVRPPDRPQPRPMKGASAARPG